MSAAGAAGARARGGVYRVGATVGHAAHQPGGGRRQQAVDAPGLVPGLWLAG